MGSFDMLSARATNKEDPVAMGKEDLLPTGR
jgi:hypothetical protein